jgi:mono/diheme cytochrome c family protein
MRTAIVLLLLMVTGMTTPALADVDVGKGKVLHDRKCIACHAERFGGDGSTMYLRPDRIIHDRAALDQRVATCSTMTHTGWFPDDEDNVATYLATRYYKFEPVAAPGRR